MQRDLKKLFDYPTRSEILTANDPSPKRIRPYLTRNSIIFISGFIIYLIGLVYASRLIPLDHPLAIIYWFHDVFYLWLKGYTWIMYFPYVLIWLCPLLVIVSIAIIEFLTPINITRRLQRTLIRSLFLSFGGRKLLQVFAPTAKILDPIDWNNEFEVRNENFEVNTGFVLRVLNELLVTNRHAIQAAFEHQKAPNSKDMKESIELTNFRLDIGGIGPIVICKSLECIVQHEIYGKTNKNEIKQISQNIENIIGKSNKLIAERNQLESVNSSIKELVSSLSLSRSESLKKVLQTVSWFLTDNPTNAIEIVSKFLLATALILKHDLPVGQKLLEAWLYVRLGNNGHNISQAEQLIEFSYWALLIEINTILRQELKVTNGIWPNRLRSKLTGESFAWLGVNPV